MSKSVAIIGAGIGGLAVGCYLQMNGYETRIFEMHDKPGGLCTAWQRKGYTIDGCLQWLWGSSPSQEIYAMWEQLGIKPRQEIINMDDSTFIEEFTGAIRHFSKINMPIDKSPETYTLWDYISYLLRFEPTIISLRKWSYMTLGEMSQHFKNPFMKKVWTRIWDSRMSVFNLLMSLAPLHNKSAGYPLGGSMAVVHSIEMRYLNLGGKITYKKKVDKILIESNRATGVRFID